MRRHNQQSIYTDKKRQGTPPFVYLIILLVIALLAFIIATLWQNLEENANSRQSSASEQSSLSSSGSESESSEPESSDSASSEDETSESSESESSDSQSSVVFFNYGQVPEGERVTSEYFDDALMVGDSLTEGIQLYSIMKNATVIAGTGINVTNIATREAVSTEDGRMTIPDKMKQYPDAGKIYIMLGANGMAYSLGDFVYYYGEFIDLIRQQHPKAIIYIQSILPINEQLFYANYTQDYNLETTNEKIDEYNAAIAKMAGEKKVFYLHVADAMKNIDNELPEEATTDGMHIGPTYYDKWFEYLKKHTVPQGE